MLATDPVIDSSGLAKSACASTYASPTRLWPAAVPRAVAGAEQAAEHDAAVAAKNNHEPIVFEPFCDLFAERSAVRGHSGLVPGLAGRPREVLVARRQHLAEVGGVQPLDHAARPEDTGPAVHVLRRTGLAIRAKTDAGGGSMTATALRIASTLDRESTAASHGTA